MNGNEELPIECPHCPEGNKHEFYNAQGVDSHFAFSDGHPTHDTQSIKERIQQAQNTSSKQEDLPTEEEVIEKWAENNYPQSRYTPEVPVQPSPWRGNAKFIDVVVFEKWPFKSEQEYQKKAIENRALDINTGEFPDREQQVQFILQQFNREPVRVRIFEAKRELNFKSIGQILGYSEFFPEYYSPYADIEVIEKGIIYAKEDEMCFKTAERHGISLHAVDW